MRVWQYTGSIWNLYQRKDISVFIYRNNNGIINFI